MVLFEGGQRRVVLTYIWKFVVWSFVFGTTITLLGCSSAVELNDRAFVKMMLLDKSESGVEVTLSFPLPNRLIPGQVGGAGGQTGKPYAFVTKTGRDIGEAYRFIQSDLSRRITFGQTTVVVIGNSIAKEGITPVLEFIAREPRFHVNATLFVTPGKVTELTRVPIVFERFPVDILIAYNKQHVTVQTTVKDCMEASFSGGDFLAPMLSFQNQAIPGQTNDVQAPWLGTKGAAVFKAGKLVGELDTNEMRGAMWIQEMLKDSEITVPSSQDGKKVSFMIKNNRTTIKPIVDGNRITFRIRCKANADLISSESDLDFDEADQRSRLESGIARLIEERISKAITTTRMAGADPFHFGQYIDWHYPSKWKKMKREWRLIYTEQVKFDIHASIIIKHLGTEKNPIHFPIEGQEGGAA